MPCSTGLLVVVSSSDVLERCKHENPLSNAAILAHACAASASQDIDSMNNSSCIAMPNELAEANKGSRKRDYLSHVMI